MVVFLVDDVVELDEVEEEDLEVVEDFLGAFSSSPVTVEIGTLHSNAFFMSFIVAIFYYHPLNR